MEIEKLLIQPESKVLEFKRDLSSLDSILKTIVAFANTAGGTLIIGRSADGTLTGVKDVFKAEEALANSIADSIRPAMLPEIEIATVEGKNLLVVRVSYWKSPFYIKKEGMPKGVYIRLGSTSRPANAELLAELQRSVLNLSFDQQAVPDVCQDALQFDLAFQLFQQVGKDINEEKFLSLGILLPSLNNRVVPSIGGLILFGKKIQRQQFVPDARVSCARFLGNDKTHILDRYEVEGTILNAVSEVPKFIARNTRLAAQVQEIRRKDIPEYSPTAIRETLMNALVHADYSIIGSHIQIAIFNNRLEIQNPGMLPFGFTLEDLKSGVSRIRNRVITRVFHKLNLMEEWGSGYKRIVEACRLEGYPEPKWEELGTSMRVTLYPHPQTLLVFQDEQQSQSEPVPELIERQKAILDLFKADVSLPFREILKGLSTPLSERMLHYDLNQLKKNGILISKGKGRATVWQKPS